MDPNTVSAPARRAPSPAGEPSLERQPSRLALISAYAGDLVNRGVVSGLFAGFVFILAQYGWFARLGRPPLAPLQAIATIFHGTKAPPTPPVPADAIIGLTLHAVLAMTFGLGFAAIVAGMALTARPLRTFPALAIVAIGYGLLLYVFNFQIFTAIWPAFEKAPQGFEIWIHAAYGFLLAPFFLGVASRMATVPEAMRER